MRIVVTPSAFSHQDELNAFLANASGAGALATFVGLARSETHTDPVTALELESYPGFTEREVERIAQDALLAHGLIDILIIHRVGMIAPGDAIVLVAALSTHRREAFAAVEQIMDYLKTDAPLWKREHRREGGAKWVEPTHTDKARRARYDKDHA